MMRHVLGGAAFAMLLLGGCMERDALDAALERATVREEAQRPSLEARAARYVRPYGASAPWNVPVAGLPRHPRSDFYSRMLWNGASDRPGNFNLAFDTYTYPVYSASEATSRYTVRTRWPSNLQGRSIPWNPEWRPAPGTDGQVIVIDERRGREWNLYKAEVGDGVITATNGSLVPGDYRTRTRGYPPSRGVGIPYLAMLVRPEEIARGRIEHALAMPIRNTSGEYYVAPATKLERATGRPGVPEGMRFALDVTEEEIARWAAGLPASEETRRAARIIARALRDYGWFITDTSGSASFQFEANVSAGEDWERLGLGAGRMPAAGASRVLPRDLLDGLLRRDRIYAIVPSDRY